MRRRSLRIGALTASCVLLASGSVAAARAHKTIDLDVDGSITHVATFAGSVDGLLEEQGVGLGDRDIVAPQVDASLDSGDLVVVRHAHQVTVSVDGEDATIWTTALTADEALAGLSGRGFDVRLLPSRSTTEGRPDISLDLSDRPVDVIVDGRTDTIEDGAVGLAHALADLAITVGESDRVSIVHGSADRLAVRIQRVVVAEETTTSAIPFEATAEQADDLYEGQTRTATEGVNGELTTVSSVVRVDGVEESRNMLSETVTLAPVTQVVREGTRKRQVAAPTPSGTTSVPTPSGTTSTAGGDVWAALAQCESGGNPTSVSGNGKYYGLYQFSVSTWQAVGGTGLPSEASAAEQTERAAALQARSGWGQWPACAARLGLL